MVRRMAQNAGKGPVTQDEESGSSTQCTPHSVTNMIGVLPHDVRNRLIEMGLSKLLDLKLDGLGSREALAKLMRTAIVRGDKKEIEFPIKSGFSLFVNKDVFRHVLPLPEGHIKKWPVSDADDCDVEYNKMLKALILTIIKYEDEYTKPNHVEKCSLPLPLRAADAHSRFHVDNLDVTIKEYMLAKHKRLFFSTRAIQLLARHFDDEEVSSGLTRDSLVRLFLGVVIQHLLLPAASSYVTKPTLDKVYNLDGLKDIDWAHFAFQQFLEDVDKKGNMDSCVAVLMVSTRSRCK